MHLWLCDSANPKHGQWTKRFGGFLIKQLGFFFFKNTEQLNTDISVFALFAAHSEVSHQSVSCHCWCQGKNPRPALPCWSNSPPVHWQEKLKVNSLALRVFLKLLCVFLEIVHYKVILVSCNGMVCFSIVSHTFLCVRIYPGHHITRNDI